MYGRFFFFFFFLLLFDCVFRRREIIRTRIMTHFNQYPRSYNVPSSFSRHKKYRHHFITVESSSRTIMPSKTTSSADDGPVKKRPSAKEELERTMRRHETHADHVARDLGTRLQLHFPSRRTLFFVCLRKSHSLSLSLSVVCR